jgi:hypothetical protein
LTLADGHFELLIYTQIIIGIVLGMNVWYTDMAAKASIELSDNFS